MLDLRVEVVGCEDLQFARVARLEHHKLGLSLIFKVAGINERDQFLPQIQHFQVSANTMADPV